MEGFIQAYLAGFPSASLGCILEERGMWCLTSLRPVVVLSFVGDF